MTAETMPVGEMPAREGDFTVEGHGMEPIPENARYGSVSRVFTVWFTPNLVPAAFFIGTLVTLSFLQLGFWTSILAIIVGNVVGALFVALLSTMGPKLGLAQMPAARLPFGKSIVAAGAAELAEHHRLGWHQQRLRRDRADHPHPGLPVLGGAAGHRGLPGRAGDHRLRGHPHLREMDGIRAGRHVRGADHLDLRPGPGRHQRRRWHERRGPGRCLRRLRRHRRQLRPRLVPLRLGLLSLPALQHGHRAASSGTRCWRPACRAGWLEILGVLVASQATGGESSDTIYAVLGGSGSIIAALAMIAIFIGTIAVNAMNDYTGSLSLQAAGVKIKRVFSAAAVAVLGYLFTLFLQFNGDFSLNFFNFLLFISYWISPFVGVVLADWWLRGRSADAWSIVDFARLPTPASVGAGRAGRGLHRRASRSRTRRSATSGAGRSTGDGRLPPRRRPRLLRRRRRWRSSSTGSGPRRASAARLSAGLASQQWASAAAAAGASIAVSAGSAWCRPSGRPARAAASRRARRSRSAGRDPQAVDRLRPRRSGCSSAAGARGPAADERVVRQHEQPALLDQRLELERPAGDDVGRARDHARAGDARQVVVRLPVVEAPVRRAARRSWRIRLGATASRYG